MPGPALSLSVPTPAKPMGWFGVELLAMDLFTAREGFEPVPTGNFRFGGGSMPSSIDLVPKSALIIMS